MTGVELGSGIGAGFTISGSTPGGGLITPPLASNLSLRFFLWLSTTLPPCAPPKRDCIRPRQILLWNRLVAGRISWRGLRRCACGA